MDLHIYDAYHQRNKYENSVILDWDGKKINELLEKNKKEIRLKYLNIIYDVINKNSKKYKFLDVKKINLLKLSLINEKNPFKSKSIHDCLKLLLIEKIVIKNKIKKIYYHGKNFEIEKSIRLLSINYKLAYNKNLIFTFPKSRLIYFFLGNIFFIKQLIKNLGLNKNFKKYSNTSIFSYFVHFSKSNNIKFKSNLWGNLNEYFNKKKKNINWFHFYVPSNQVSSSKKANILQSNFNHNKYENHNFVNSYFSKREIIKSYIFFYNLFIKNIFLLQSEKKIFENKISKVNFCFFLKDDFLSSLFGSTLIYNIVNIMIFNNILKNIPHQKLGLYIIENQSWEYCLIKFWRKYKHGKLIAYFNSSIRFWDLRYLRKKKQYINKDENPDLYLLNNKLFKAEADKQGFPKNKTFVVEALRYNKLLPLKKKIKNKKIIIIGDILFKETKYLLSFVNKIKSELKNYKLFFKPHPTMTKKSISNLIKEYNYINITNINSDKFKNFEFAICSNGTSANLDCLIQNINFCSVKPYNSLNLYPLEKYQKYYQVGTPSELIKRIKNPKKNKNKFFFETTKGLSKFEKFFY